ncbi:MAG: hypothetical protein ACM3RX_08890 [Methanococcaceae archaeon]
MRKLLVKLGLIIIVLIPSMLSLHACSRDSGAPTKPQDPAPVENKDILEFSGMRWTIKKSTHPVGPGGNYFSGEKEDLWVDSQDRLHMKISRKKDYWACTEIYTEKPVGYGTYVFYLSSKVDSLDPNAVLGLFTWNNSSSQTDANSEIDIEVSRWAVPNSKILNYSVQPVFGPDTPSGKYSERGYQKHMQQNSDFSVHTFTWTDSLINFASYNGKEIKAGNQQIAAWTFYKANPARRTQFDGTLSDAIIIPNPRTQTTLNINLWLVGKNGYGMPPYNNKDIEVIIDKVEYIPAAHPYGQ